jgi:hypothetical protein
MQCASHYDSQHLAQTADATVDSAACFSPQAVSVLVLGWISVLVAPTLFAAPTPAVLPTLFACEEASCCQLPVSGR